jgi:ATP-dependent helicase/DNAse subunit B
MPLKLIQGPPNSGRAEKVRRGFRDALERGPVLVVPRVDDVFRFERELCASGAVLGGAAMTFADLFRQVVTTAGAPPRPELGRAQRLQAISAAVAERRASLRALRDSAGRAGFAKALDQLLGELQGAGLGPNSVEAAAETLEGSAYLGDISSLYSGYAEACERLGRTDSHGIARQAIALLRKSAELWAARPVFLEGFDDLTPNQLDLVEALAERTEVTVALPFDPAHPAFAERTRLLDALRKRIGIDEEVRTEADPQSAENPFLFELEQDFGSDRAAPRPLGEGLTLLRSAGERGEAEAIAAVVGRLLHEGATEDEIAIVLRDPERRGGLLARVLESCGIAIALEAELPVSSTGVGGALIALLEAEHGTRRAGDVLRWLRGPAAVSAGRVDWLERRIRRRRLQSAEEALAAWLDQYEELPRDLRRLREAGPEGLVGEAGAIARRMAARFVAGGEDGPPPGPGDGGELRAAATISGALAELAELPQIAPGPEELIGFLRGLSFRVWSGPIEGRVRIADPRRLRGSRFNHVIVGSLQDGEFPRLGGGDPFLSERQRVVLGLDPRREVEAEERYLFHACLALPRRSLYLSYRDSDANGAAEARSPLIDEVRRLLDPPPDLAGGGLIEESITLGRDLAQVVHRVGEAPSPDELT